MTRIDLVRLYNRLSWYFCMTKYPNINTKTTESCETLLNELNKLYEENQLKDNNSGKLQIKNNNSAE